MTRRRATLVRHGLSITVLCLGLVFAVPSAKPRSVNAAPSTVDVQRLIRNAAWNQIASMRNRSHRYEYVHQDITPGNSQTTLEIETAQGMVARLTAVKGHPPSEKQCHRNVVRLGRIARNLRLQRSRLKEQQSEMSLREQLFRAFPSAFIFHYDGAEAGTGWIRVRYEPNPAFRPRSRPAGVLAGLAGTMWVDPSSQRFVKIDGHVVKTVTFGWGILARLSPGGRYLMEEKRLPNGDWRLATLQVSLRGTILLVKKLSVDMKELYGSYKEVAINLTLPAAVRMLESVPVHCAQ